MDNTCGCPLRFRFDCEKTGPFPTSGTPTVFFGTVEEVIQKIKAQLLTTTRNSNLDEESLKKDILMHGVLEETALVEVRAFIEQKTDEAVRRRRTEEARDLWEPCDSVDLEVLERSIPRPVRGLPRSTTPVPTLS